MNDKEKQKIDRLTKDLKAAEAAAELKRRELNQGAINGNLYYQHVLALKKEIEEADREVLGIKKHINRLGGIGK